jgi:hypothetical protein
MNAPVHNFRIVSIYSLGSNKKQQSWDGRGGRAAPRLVRSEPKRRVRASHGRARAAKTH